MVKHVDVCAMQRTDVTDGSKAAPGCGVVYGGAPRGLYSAWPGCDVWWRFAGGGMLG